MKRVYKNFLFFYSALLIFSGVFFVGAKNSLADEADAIPICSENIALVEIFPFSEEFAKIENKGEEECNLRGWSVTDSIGYDPDAEELKNKSWSYHRKQFSEDAIIEPDDFAYLRGNLYLNDTEDTLKLFNPQKVKVQSVSYENASSHKGLAYIFEDGQWNWEGEKEIEAEPETESESETNELNLSVEISHDKKTYPKIYDYFEAEIADANGKTLKLDRIGKKYEYACSVDGAVCASPVLKFTWDFGDKHKSYLFSTKHKYEEVGTYLASLTIYDPESKKKTIKNFTVVVGEVSHPEVRIVSVNPNPKGSDSNNETITVQNKSKKKINLKGWSIATGWKKLINHPISEDFQIKPGKKKEITREFSKFTLNNKKTKIELRYPDGEVVDEVKYKNKEGIAEGEVYAKGKNKKWTWTQSQKSIKSVKSIKQENDNQQLAISNLENAKKEEASIKDEEVGKQSKIEKEVLLFEAEPALKLQEINFEPYVLGAEDVKEIDGIYHFTPEYVEPKHYAIAFAENIMENINIEINRLFDHLTI